MIRLTAFQNKMVEANIDLVYRWVNTKGLIYGTLYKSQKDMEQVAFLGLCQAAYTFEFPRDIQFSSWAYWCIKGAVQNNLQNEFVIRRPYSKKFRGHNHGFTEATNADVCLELHTDREYQDKDFDKELEPLLNCLTKRQKEAVALFRQGLRQRKIAKIMGTSPCRISELLKTSVERIRRFHHIEIQCTTSN